MRRPSDFEVSCGIGGNRFRFHAAPPHLALLLAGFFLGGHLFNPFSGVAATSAAEPKTQVDVSLYFLGAAMSGDVTVGNATADLDVGFDEILDHMEFGVMGFGRVTRAPWSFTAEVLYMGLGASKDLVNSNFDQWVVEPRVGYRVSPRLEPFLGVRYNNLAGEIRGPFGRRPSDTQDWWDPIVGATATMPLGRTLALAGHGDVGGFGIGSDLTWQVYPYLDWSFMPNASLQAGYRWLDVDYETGSGADTFHYNVLTQGPQLGVTVRLGN
jgi:hypothetical protein